MAEHEKDDKEPPGVAVDSRGGPVVDPTKNVTDLVKAEKERGDDLRALNDRLVDAKLQHLKEIADIRAENLEKIGKLREEYQEKIAHAESGRLDSIRQVDREEVAKTAVGANTAIQTLAKQTTDLQQTLAKQVADTAAAQEARNSAQYSDTNKRLSALELSSSEGKGKQTRDDPQMLEMMTEIRRIGQNQYISTGHSEGGNAVWGYIVGGIGVLCLIIGLVWSMAHTTQAVPVYVPSTTQGAAR